MDIICEFSVGFDKEIEDISMYDDVSDEYVRSLLDRIVRERKLIVGERSEGSISVDRDFIKIEYRWCSDVGEEWSDDVWNDEVLNLDRVNYEI